ncbi:phytoene desaturase family protein [Mycetocola reblochoni]|uniref:Phytoene dehydrogenase n=2 Tax=Mycetocola reblochoni TaxID=331618 RepID=A0A1R4I7D5_9MICO|nr:phytoene desaturase family protein [Mycetocola reblochoni]RLP68920.1 phytoene desaturase [Mycetocola reblochoni]SJN15745.1 Phytoene dehydrogenase [Mycetocola reblochoni REB411]
MSRVVVIGGGVGGLSAAARLAHAGHRVRLLETSGSLGGKLGVLERDGYRFDTGPSLVTMPQVFAELFEATGSSLAAELPLRRLDTACRYRFPDGTVLDMPGHREAIAGALDAALGGDAGAQWTAFLSEAEQVWDVAEGPFLREPISWPTIVRLAARPASLARLAPWRSLRGYGARTLRDPRLGQLLDRYATYTGSDPRLAPSALATVPYAEQQFGSWYVPGGLSRIAEAIAGRAVAAGAVLETGVEVVAIEHDGSRATGVRTADGELIGADVVVANADAATVYGRLVRGSRRAEAAGRALARTTPSLSGFVLLLALHDLPEELRDPSAHHRVLFTDDYDAEFDAVFGTGCFAVTGPRPVADPTVYVTAPADPAIVPGETDGAWFVLVNAPRHDPASGVDWDAPGVAEAYADRVLEVMAERGLDVRPYLRWRVVRSPAVLERETGAPGGSIYGSSSNGARAAFRRPSNRSPLAGLFLAGGSAHPGGGLPLVALSAQIVAEQIGPA